MENLIPTKTIKENGVVAVKNGIKPNSNKLIPIERKPTWLRVKSQNSRKYKELKSIVSDKKLHTCLLYTSPSPRDQRGTRMPSSA